MMFNLQKNLSQKILVAPRCNGKAYLAGSEHLYNVVLPRLARKRGYTIINGKLVKYISCSRKHFRRKKHD